MSHRILLVGALALVLLAAACSDDDESPTAPPCLPCEDGVIEIPGEVATLAEAVAIATAGDTLRIAQGAYDGDVTVTRALVIMAERDDVSWPILDTTTGPLTVRLGSGTVELANLAFSGGATGLELELQGGEVIAGGLYLDDNTHGITVDGDGGTVDLTGATFHNSGDANGDGSGLRVRGDNQVSLDECRFEIDAADASGVAATVGDESALTMNTTTVEDHAAGTAAVVACASGATLILGSVEFRRCSGIMVDGSGLETTWTSLLAEDCNGTLVKLESDIINLGVPGLTARGCTGTVLDVGPNLIVQVSNGAVTDHAGTPFAVDATATLRLVHGTFVDVSGSLATVATGGHLDFDRSLVVDAAAQAVLGDVRLIRQCDLWHADATNAWVGLESFLGVEGNIEADPLFCDRAAGDLRLQTGTPCLLPDDSVMGAFGMGCD